MTPEKTGRQRRKCENKEASEFIKKLKIERKQRDKSKKLPKGLDDEYIQKLENMMEERKIKEVFLGKNKALGTGKRGEEKGD